ncbi:MAG: hypothetical protein Q8876_08775, partial [Bacillota bacterium]|nr:hypothetical protein [Bacillota bacterium]
MTYEMKKSTVLRNTLIAVVIAAVLGFLVFYLAAPTPKSSPLDKDNIVAISQQAVEAKIKNTASATFPWGWISGTGGLDTTENGDYQV